MTELSDELVQRLQQRTPEATPATRYTLHDMLGQGGMGVVYRATDELLERDVAMKVAHQRTGPGAGGLVDRLRHEARILARLEHPGIVPVHDAGVLADGRVFYVMKLVHGRTLDTVIPTDTSRALDIMERVAATVAFAHDRGIVHRDIKPGNVMIGDFGEVVVMDWGVATSMGTSDTQLVGGTPGFMPPEQAAGSPADGRADVFALGVLMERLAPSPQPKRLRAVIARCQAPNPANRYPDAGSVMREIQRLRTGQPVEAHRETWLDGLERWVLKYQAAILLVCGYLIMRVIVALGSR